MPQPRFSIVIPTHNRCDTLYHTLRTCLAQDFNDFEVVVSDNFSTDETKHVVEKFASNKLHYVRTPSLLAMSDSWEFALSHARGEYIIVFGDDDGILLHALRDLDAFLSETGAKVVRWNRVYYSWPNIPIGSVANQIVIPIKSDDFLDAETLLVKIANSEADYTQLPMLYNSAVHRDLVDHVRQRAGRVFFAAPPDVISGFSFAYLAQQYHSIGRPMTINGGAAKSNGTASRIRDSQIFKDYNLLNERANLKLHSFVPVLPVLSVALASAFLHTNSKLMGRDGKKYINRKHLVLNCLEQSRWIFDDEEAKTNVLQILKRFVEKETDRELSRWFEHIVHLDRYINYSADIYKKQKGIIGENLCLDGDDFDISNVYDVVLLYEKLTGHLSQPYKFEKPKIPQTSTKNNILRRFLDKQKRILLKKYKIIFRELYE